MTDIDAGNTPVAVASNWPPMNPTCRAMLRAPHVLHGAREDAPQGRGVFGIHFLVLVDHVGGGDRVEPVEGLERGADHEHRESAELARFTRGGRAGTKAVRLGLYSLYCAVIVKRMDTQTRSKTSINELLRAD